MSQSMLQKFRGRRQLDTMITTLSITVSVMWMAAISLLAYYVLTVAGEVTYVSLADGRKAERSIPLVFKILLPFCPNFQHVVKKPIFKNALERAEDLLTQAGFETLISPEEFVSLQLMLFWIGPNIWLYRQVRARHLSIMKSLPFVMDVLTLSVEAGMDFISALQRNCKSRKMDPLNEELLRMTKEIQMGSSRRDALKAMITRVKEPNLKSVAFSLIQADELGVSIGAILRIQSEQLRQCRFDRAEKLANTAPTKMLVPLLLCIFPAVFIILLGPVIAQASKGTMF